MLNNQRHHGSDSNPGNERKPMYGTNETTNLLENGYPLGSSPYGVSSTYPMVLPPFLVQVLRKS